MAEPTMPDDPAAITKRYATVAKKTVTDGAKVVTDAFEKINADPPPAQRYNSGTPSRRLPTSPTWHSRAVSHSLESPCSHRPTEARCWWPTTSHRS